MAKRKFLAVDDYGTGGIWFAVFASSEDEIRTMLPTVKVYPSSTKPDWMSDELLADIERRRTVSATFPGRNGWMGSVPPTVDRRLVSRFASALA